MRSSWIISAPVLLLLSVAPVAAQTVTLANDGYPTGGAAYQSGFVAGEMFAATFTGTAAWRLDRVELLFGPAGSAQTVTLHVYDDSAGTAAPGTLIYIGDHQLVPTDSSFSITDLSAANIIVPASFRVAVELQHSGAPGPARDNDGNIVANRNWIFATGLGWLQSSAFGLTGDWVLRAAITNPDPNLFGDGFEPTTH